MPGGEGQRVPGSRCRRDRKPHPSVYKCCVCVCLVGASGCRAVSPGARAEQLIKTVPVIPG